MAERYTMHQIPIDSFFKYRQEPIYVVYLNLTYEELAEKYDFDYEVWEEEGLGPLIGAALEIEEYKYFLKAAKDYVKPHTQVSVYVQAGTINLKSATEKFLTTLNISQSEVSDIGEYFYNTRWQLVRETKEDGHVVINNFLEENDATKSLERIQRKYEDNCYVRKFS